MVITCFSLRQFFCYCSFINFEIPTWLTHRVSAWDIWFFQSVSKNDSFDQHFLWQNVGCLARMCSGDCFGAQCLQNQSQWEPFGEVCLGIAAFCSDIAARVLLRSTLMSCSGRSFSSSLQFIYLDCLNPQYLAPLLVFILNNQHDSTASKF